MDETWLLPEGDELAADLAGEYAATVARYWDDTETLQSNLAVIDHWLAQRPGNGNGNDS